MTIEEARALLNDREWVATASREDFETVYHLVQDADIARQFQVIESASGPGGIVRRD